MQELTFPDGQLPSQTVINKWLKIVSEFFDSPSNKSQKAEETENQLLEQKSPVEETKQEVATSTSLKKKQAGVSTEGRIGVHCVAGLGRAPLLVAIALVNKGCPPVMAIDLIRKNRKGALNVIQANYILEFKAKRNGNEAQKCKCF